VSDGEKERDDREWQRQRETERVKKVIDIGWTKTEPNIWLSIYQTIYSYACNIIVYVLIYYVENDTSFLCKKYNSAKFIYLCKGFL